MKLIESMRHFIASYRSLFLLAVFLVLIQCNPESQIVDDLLPSEIKTGLLEIEFRLPEFHLLPQEKVHRANLCVAYTPDSLYRNEYIDCANTSDVQETYQFALLPGTYYYQAGLTCTAQDDSCLWGGFPGGNLGMKWTMTRVVIEKNKTTLSKTVFQ